MDAREITQQDLGTSAQVTGDAQMLFLQRYVSLRASHLNCFSAVSWKPLLKCFQEPGIEFYQQLHMDPATCLICSSSPLRNPTFTVKCGVFTTVLSDSPRGKCLALPAAVRPLFFFNYYFWQAKTEAFNFCPRGKNMKLGPNWEFPYCLVRSLLLHSQLQPCSFQLSPMDFAFWS